MCQNTICCTVEELNIKPGTLRPRVLRLTLTLGVFQGENGGTKIIAT